MDNPCLKEVLAFRSLVYKMSPTPGAGIATLSKDCHDTRIEDCQEQGLQPCTVQTARSGERVVAELRIASGEQCTGTKYTGRQRELFKHFRDGNEQNY